MKVHVLVALGIAASATSAPASASDAAEATRVALVYLAQPPLSGRALGLTDVGLDYGLELSTPRRSFRYHATLAFTTVAGLTGFRLEPASIGWPLSIYRGSAVTLELEPVVNFLNGQLFVRTAVGRSLWALGSGANVRLNVVYEDRWFFTVSPVGFDVRYLGFGGFSSPNVVSDCAVDWNARAAAGVSF